MARMSIDDKFPRDPRVVLLGRRFGWSRRETMGALLDVFQIAYDMARDVIPAALIDVTAEREGFAVAMTECDLAEVVRAGVRIKGAAERIGYLNHKSEAGRAGGVKSGESRRNRREAKRGSASEADEARGNPNTLPSAPDLALAPEEDLGADSPDVEPAKPPAAPLTLLPEPPARPPRKKAKHDLPETWQPTARQREVAQQSALDLDDQVRRFRNHHAARGNQFVSWDRAFDTWLDNAPRFAEGTRSGPRGCAERAPEPPRKIPTLA